MRLLHPLAAAALLGVCLAPAVRAGELYSYTDKDGVMHFSNAPSDARYRKVRRATASAGGVYRAEAQPSARPLPRGESVDRWRAHVKAAADKYNLPEALLLAVMSVESNFDPRAVSEKGAVGLMQLMPGTAREMFVSNSFEPSQNIEGGARYLRILANQYGGDMVRTLAAYNAGPEAVRRAGGQVPDIPETQEYVRKVVHLYKALKAGL